jgi:hypothetical protein
MAAQARDARRAGPAVGVDLGYAARVPVSSGVLLTMLSGCADLVELVRSGQAYVTISTANVAVKASGMPARSQPPHDP